MRRPARRTPPSAFAWVTRGCPPELVGRDPGLQSSIVDVDELADGRTEWWFVWSGIIRSGGVAVQLWDAGCREIVEGYWRSIDLRTRDHSFETFFTIPTRAKWMTVVTVDTASISWRLY
jgi:hypothetical protein